LAAFSEHDAKMMKIAGYLHDLGKLAVPVEILNKPSKLTKEEFQIIKSHSYYTYRILEPITGFKIINSWASFHHECLNGSGYPFHHGANDLSLGSRITAVADIFTALTEDRPYRSGMDKENVLGIIRKLVNENAIDANIVSLLELNYENVNQCRLAAQDISREEYDLLKQPVDFKP
jgi:HD-GYP domain-containing protein (c-di-GMP phosphodiesterase class II)